MHEVVQGDIFQSAAQSLVNPVNCAGIMGKGLALEFKRRYPGNYQQYRAACKAGSLTIGQMFITLADDGKYITNFPTKVHWRDRSRIEWVELGLVALVSELKSRSIQTVAIPALGVGLGGLDWYLVRPLMENSFSNESSLKAFIYKPRG